ncbi:hypothetical protein OS493_028017 [Desmophyllum pertusum]|uniref:ER-bound oxygenase mpaB/mpaB'/Rubber oxygenase catalytic domain-containing protein n=1 Tax=Desmophyllum pertusum TaxID=174260 RepID=A0A9W9ZYY2_9CNID|nr:hypothetical protein OS493_028017 [Desmophyllum pertusum]
MRFCWVVPGPLDRQVKTTCLLPLIFTRSLLSKKRFECDPLADKAVLEALRDRGETVLRNHELYSAVKELGRTLKESSCAQFVEFYEQEPPLEYRVENVRVGTTIFCSKQRLRRPCFLCMVVLFSTFTAALGNKVLSAMGRLSPYGDVRQRLFENSLLCEDCCSWFLQYGHPINQEDLAGTLSTFSSVVIYGLELLGVSATQYEKNGYQTLWKYVGYYLGMSNDLLCNSYEDEWELCTVIRRRQCKPDKDSKTLTESLLLEFANKPPFHLSYTTTSRLSRHFIGDDLADELGLERSNMLSRTMTVLSYCFS